MQQSQQQYGVQSTNYQQQAVNSTKSYQRVQTSHYQDSSQYSKSSRPETTGFPIVPSLSALGGSQSKNLRWVNPGNNVLDLITAAASNSAKNYQSKAASSHLTSVSSTPSTFSAMAGSSKKQGVGIGGKPSTYGSSSVSTSKFSSAPHERNPSRIPSSFGTAAKSSVSSSQASRGRSRSRLLAICFYFDDTHQCTLTYISKFTFALKFYFFPKVCLRSVNSFIYGIQY